MMQIRATVSSYLKTASALALLSFLAAPSLKAATLIGNYEGAASGTYDLSSIGALDWAYWNAVSNSSVTGPILPTNEKAGGSVIGGISAVGGTSLRGSNSSNKPNLDFSFTDGVSPISGSANDVIGPFNPTLATAGRGVSLSFVLPSTDSFSLTIWVGGYSGTGNFTASLSGASDYNSTEFSGGFTKSGGVYTLQATPDAPNQVLTVTFTLNNSPAPGDSAHMFISGAAISIIPEPSTTLLLIAGLLLFLACKKIPIARVLRTATARRR